MYRAVPCFLFFLSGFSSLVYEVVWSRMLVLVFGNTTLATSVIVSSFMAGLAIGSYFWGKYASHWKKGPLGLFGLLEILTGVYALLFPILLRAATAMEVWLSGDVTLGYYPFAILRGLLCFALILPPTFLMGGTFAVLGKYLIMEREKIGRDTALLYGLNTAGAVFGAAMAGFLLVRELGHSGGTYLAAGINLLVGTTAVLMGRRWNARRETPGTESAPNITSPARPGGKFILVLFGLGVSGFCALGYEVLWTRLLILVVDNSIYSFTAILVAFLLGIAAGSLLLAPLAEKIRNPVLAFGLSQLGIGVIAYLFPFSIQVGSVQGTVHYYAFLFQMIFFIVMAATILMGVALPLAIRICGTRQPDVGASIGIVYGTNTLGAVAGSLTAGFLLIPFLGLQKSSVLLPGINWIIGAALMWSSLSGRLRKGLTAGFAVILLLGIFLTPQDLFEKKYGALVPGGRMIFYNEGLAATTTIMDKPSGERILFLNGIPQVQNDPTSMKTFKIMGALPCLMQEKPGSGLAITFGAGITSSVMAGFVEGLDCVELVEEAPKIADHFSAENNHVLKNGNVRLHINDARHFLLTGRKRYGVIVADATHPRGYDSWILFTKEFYDLVKKRLEPGGVFAQWVPFHGMNLEQYMAIARTFLSAFPNCSIWTVDQAHSLLLGFDGQEKIDFARLSQRMSQAWARETLRPVRLDDPFRLLSHFTMGSSGMEKMLSKFPDIITDDSPRNLFFPVGATFGEQYGQWPEENYRYLLEHQESVIPYLTNLGDSEEQSASILKRLRMQRRSR